MVKIMNSEIATYALWKNNVTRNYRLTCIGLICISAGIHGWTRSSFPKRKQSFENEPLSIENSAEDLPDHGRKLIPRQLLAFMITVHIDPSAHVPNVYEIWCYFMNMHFIDCLSSHFYCSVSSWLHTVCNVCCQLISVSPRRRSNCWIK